MILRRAVLIPLVLVSGLLAACSKSQSAAAPAGGRGPGALTVRVAPVQVRDVTYKIQAVGSLEAEEVVQVTAEVEGPVTVVGFHEGARVGPDTVLARIDPERYRLEAAKAEAAYKKAQADHQRAASELRRREELANEKLVALEELTRARQEAERLEAEAEAVKAAWNIALQNQRRSDVRPSRRGVVNTKAVETGQYVRMGTVLATIVDTSRLRLRFKVSEGESLRARRGQSVRFTVASLGSAEFDAQIYHVGEMADPATRQVEVLAWVKNPGVLKPGFFAELTLASETRSGTTIVPERAVQASERGFVTYVVEDGKARARPVQIGIRTGDGGVEIMSGVKPGEIVVVEGSDRLADGIAVQPVGAGPTASAAAAPPPGRRP